MLTNTANNDFGNLLAEGQGFADSMHVCDIADDDLKRRDLFETVLAEHRLQLSRVADQHATVVALCQRPTEGGETAACDRRVNKSRKKSAVT